MRNTSHLLAGTFVCLLATVPLAGQAIQIEPGQQVRGELDQGDQVSSDGSYHDVYLLQGRAGDRVEISMSADFDTFLWIGRSNGSGFDALETDDDGGTGTDSRLDVTLPADGIYQILANSLSAGDTGPYTLRVGTPDRVSGQTIRAGETRVGRLESGDRRMEDDSYFDDYLYRGRANEVLVITMESADFDTYLTVGRIEGGSFDLIESNDDGAGGTDSRLEITLPSSGTWVIRANSLYGGSRGDYTLRLRSY